MRGRPPLRPFLRAAAALAADDFRPPTRPSSASHSGPANTEERRPGTLRSRSRLSQCKPPPRPRISTARMSCGAARLRLGISSTGNVIAAPFVSSIRNACSVGRYTTVLARASVFAARSPARDARAKFARSSFSTQPGIWCDLRMGTKRLGYHRKEKVSQIQGKQVEQIALSSCSERWAVLGSNQWPLPCETEVWDLQINDMRVVPAIATRTRVI